MVPRVPDAAGERAGTATKKWIFLTVTITAKTILRSRNASHPEKVLSTLLLRYPRWIHAEQRTHRLISLSEGEDIWSPSTPSLMADPNLSRNAASGRAIPFKKLADDIIADTAMPIYWSKNQKGMQASEECDAVVRKQINGELVEMSRESAWLAARDDMLEWAASFADAGYHKQLVNRLIEPFSHITVLVSATEWDNFLELRDHPDAEPHIQMLAREIRKCLEDESTIQTLEPGGWHLPFVEESEGNQGLENLIKLSVARCASTSYRTVDGFDMTLERAIQIYDKLIESKPPHESPAEHVARADEWHASFGWERPHLHTNFVGFCQWRHLRTLDEPF